MQKTVTVQEILESIKKSAYRVDRATHTETVKEELDLFGSKQTSPPEPAEVSAKPEPVANSVSEASQVESVVDEPAKKPNDDSEAAEILLRDIIEKWDTICKQVGRTNPSLASFLSSGKPLDIKKNSMTLAFKSGSSFHLSTIKSKSTVVEKCIEEVTGKAIRIKCVEDSADSDITEQENAFSNMTKKVMDIFGGEIIPT
jgi:hypothetical protein